MSHESTCSVCSRLTGFGDEDRFEPPVNLARCPAPGGLECQCQRNDPGPAAEEITRDGKRLRVCTRCKLTGDTDRVWLVTKDSPAEVFMDYDPLGFLVIIDHLSSEEPGDIEVLGGDNARESHS